MCLLQTFIYSKKIIYMKNTVPETSVEPLLEYFDDELTMIIKDNSSNSKNTHI